MRVFITFRHFHSSQIFASAAKRRRKGPYSCRLRHLACKYSTCVEVNELTNKFYCQVPASNWMADINTNI